MWAGLKWILIVVTFTLLFMVRAVSQRAGGTDSGCCQRAGDTDSGC